jgi:tetratricopeptide (TPR) repeat protein
MGRENGGDVPAGVEEGTIPREIGRAHETSEIGMTEAGATWPSVAIIVIVATGLAAADKFLARVESAETRNTAKLSYMTGSRLLREGRAGEAVDFLSNAHELERQNPDYQLQLISALTASGQTTAAEPILADILQREPNDGRTDLVAARLMSREGIEADTEAYYHRAIYGEWPKDPGARRVAARMEFIDLLAKKNKKQELLAELISLDAESPASREIQKRLADLFLFAGAPGRAEKVYEALVLKDPKDIEAYQGLGESQLEQGQYRAAHETFLRAFLREPNNTSIRAHLLTLNTVTGLDPTLRQLTSAEKYRRSIRILEMTRAALDRCVAKNPPTGSAPSSGENSDLLKMADATTGGKAPAHVTNEGAEEVLSLAEKLWHAEATACESTSSNQNALALIMKKLSA